MLALRSKGKGRGGSDRSGRRGHHRPRNRPKGGRTRQDEGVDARRDETSERPECDAHGGLSTKAQREVAGMAEIRCLAEHHGDKFAAYQGDCVDVLSQFPENSIAFSVYSPPFGSLFVYSESAADMGNSTDAEFAAHYGYLVKEKFRATMP